MMLSEENRIQCKNFCDNIAILRKRNNLSYSKMAKILHTSVKSLKSIENGVVPKRVSVDIVIYASKFFKCKAANLFLENFGE